MKWIREGETVSFCTNAPARPTCDDAFDRYTPDSCFFAGLLAADGCVSTKNRITIELKAIDELLLKAFMEFIGLENTIKYRAMPKITQWRGIYAAIGWKNLNHIRSLEDNFGITKQKSLTLSPPTIHDPDCEFAFFAGLFAGDGHVSLTSTPCINIVTASQHCSDWLQSFYGRRGIRFHHALRMNKKSSMHEIKVFSRGAVSLAAQLARVKNLEIGMARKWRVLQEIAHKQSLA